MRSSVDPEDFPPNTRAQVILIAAHAETAVQGWTKGKSLRYFTGHCPYPHRLASLRRAWMDGFDEGRKHLYMCVGKRDGVTRKVTSVRVDRLLPG